jgi:hypothetical protein
MEESPTRPDVVQEEELHASPTVEGLPEVETFPEFSFDFVDHEVDDEEEEEASYQERLHLEDEGSERERVWAEADMEEDISDMMPFETSFEVDPVEVHADERSSDVVRKWLAFTFEAEVEIKKSRSLWPDTDRSLAILSRPFHTFFSPSSSYLVTYYPEYRLCVAKAGS